MSKRNILAARSCVALRRVRSGWCTTGRPAPGLIPQLAGPPAERRRRSRGRACGAGPCPPSGRLPCSDVSDVRDERTVIGRVKPAGDRCAGDRDRELAGDCGGQLSESVSLERSRDRLGHDGLLAQVAPLQHGVCFHDRTTGLELVARVAGRSERGADRRNAGRPAARSTTISSRFKGRSAGFFRVVSELGGSRPRGTRRA